MKISFILLLVSFLSVSASSYSQLSRVSIKLTNKPISEVFEEIENQTSYSFWYETSDLDTSRKITVNAERETVKKVLETVLDGENVSFSLKDNHIVIAKKAEADRTFGASGKGDAQSDAPVKIVGVVKDASGEPVIGANIIVKGSTVGTVTDIDGNFTLNVAPRSILVVSYLGYTSQEVATADTKNFKITLKENSTVIDEVVVVGYGVQRKSDMTGGVSSINTEKLQMITSNSLLDKLTGQVPGLRVTNKEAEPGKDQSLRVRGENSLTASNDPLIVLDGIPYSGSLNDIDPDIIENLSVLKDASSSAIYGSRGANGVILIQTKKGKVGAPMVTYKGQVGMQEVQNRLNVMKGAEYVKFKQDYKAQKLGYTGDQLDPVKILNPSERDNYLNGIETDWQDIMFRSALTHSNQVSISGGTENTKYMSSVSHLSEDGVMKNTGLKRTNVALSITQDFSTWLTLGVNAQLINRNVNDNSPNREAGLKMSPYGQYKDEKGNYVDYPMDEVYYANPMANINATKDKVYRNVFVSSFADVKLPVNGLTFRTNMGYNYRSDFEGEYFGRNTLTGKSTNGKASIKNKHYTDYTWENILKYSKTFGKHKLDATGLFSLQETQRKESEQFAESFVNDDSEYYNMNAGEKNQRMTSKLTETATLSYMLRVNYNYNDRYLLTLTGRSDGYSAFGENNKYAFFPSAAVAWNLTSEKFMEETRSKWLDMLKVRLSYGSNGNQAISPYKTLDQLELSKYIWGDGGTTANGAYLKNNGVGNPNLKWETSRTANLGIDFSILNGRVFGSIDMYVANTSDLLMNRSVPIVNGFSSIVDNIGKTRNKGIEIGLNSVNIKTKDFNWGSGLNFSLNRDKIVDLRGDGKDDITNKWFIGQPLRVYYDYNVVGVWQENDPRWDSASKKYLNADGKQIQAGAKPGSAMLEDVNGDGVITSKDKKVIGSKLPSFLLSLSNQFSYKNISLSFILDGVFGMTKERKDLNLERWDMNYSYLSGMNYWTPERPSNEVTSLVYSPFDKHSFYKKVNYVQLKNITLGYNFEKQWIRTFGVSALNVNFSVNNVCSLSNVKNVMNLDADDMYASYPTNRSYMFGLNVTF